MKRVKVAIKGTAKMGTMPDTMHGTKKMPMSPTSPMRGAGKKR